MDSRKPGALFTKQLKQISSFVRNLNAKIGQLSRHSEQTCDDNIWSQSAEVLNGPQKQLFDMHTTKQQMFESYVKKLGNCVSCFVNRVPELWPDPI